MSVSRASRGRLASALSILLLLTVLWTGSAVAAGTIQFDGSPGTAAPPPTLGGYTMTPFAPDDRPPLSSVTAVPSPLGGDLLFNHTVGKGRVGQTWATWSHGYAGDVYHNTLESGSPDPSSLTMTMPANTGAFYFYVEPNVFATFEFSATAHDGTSSGPISVSGISGAKYFGFYGTEGAQIETITIATDAVGFAVGEFGIAMVPVGVRINDDAIVERDSGSRYMTLWVTLTEPSSSPVTMSYTTGNQSAVEPTDYRKRSGSVTFAPGEIRQPINIRVFGDTTLEPDETFTVRLSQLGGIATFIDDVGVGTIRNDD